MRERAWVFFLVCSFPAPGTQQAVGLLCRDRNMPSSHPEEAGGNNLGVGDDGGYYCCWVMKRAMGRGLASHLLLLRSFHHHLTNVLMMFYP